MTVLHELDVRTDVATGGWVLDAEGLSDFVWGHVSVRDPDGRGVWMKMAGLGFGEVAPEDVQLVAWDGEVLEAEGPRHAEYPIHTEVMVQRPDVGAVVHCHPEYTMALAAAGAPLHPFSHTGGIFASDVPRYEHARGLVQTSEQGRDMASALGASRALILVGHGTVTVGASVGVAVMTAIMLERACRLQYLADGFGGVKGPLDEHQALEAYPHVQHDAHMLGAWRHLARTVTARRER